MLTGAAATNRPRFAGLVLIALLTAAGLTAAGPAAAQSSGGGCAVTQPECDGWVEGPGNPGGPGHDGGGGPGDGGGGDGGAEPCYRDGVELPCYDEILGWFNRDDGCYYMRAEPQPPDGEPGQTAYQRSCAAGVVNRITVWLTDPPPGYEAPPDPYELRRRAYARIQFVPPVIHTAPDPDKPGLVGLPVWVWSEESDAVWGPLDEDEADRDVSVRVVAEVDEITFNMGNGDSFSCERAEVFDAYDPAADNPWNPGCGYDNGYPTPGNYRITATVSWDVTWFINGVEQDIFASPQVSSDPIEIEIDELQVVRR
ncbi:hypothetical protein O7621_05960 [Solwaraspora sp. WMMD937]|uniref:hypothetical protein n=1 Tax=Solwaraspora sp. WMMD937 TaxID=3016090 RepID=UPI002499F9C0|nr:hypothetical protein [Solwaraspora sp. WMMD937]WFE22878.1 hypothetical protein O7621_05960 [Solwaraspora sp. WMMD937]